MLDDSTLQLEQLLVQDRRRKLIPVWIKIFIWIFMIMGVLVVPVFLVALTGRPTALALYGLETNDGLSITGLIIFALFIFKGITALALWTENDWAVKCGFVDAIAGIIICFGSLSTLFFSHHRPFAFRLELLLLIPYLIWLVKVRSRWEASRRS